MDTKLKNIDPSKHKQVTVSLRILYLATAWLGVFLFLTVQLFSSQLDSFDDSKGYDALMNSLYEKVYSTYFTAGEDPLFATPTAKELEALNKTLHLQYCIINTSGPPISNINSGQALSIQDFYNVCVKLKSYDAMSVLTSNKINKPPYPYEVLIGLSEKSYTQLNSEYKTQKQPYALYFGVAGAILCFGMSLLCWGLLISTRRHWLAAQGNIRLKPFIPLDIAGCLISVLCVIAWSQFHSHRFNILLSSEYVMGIHITLWLFIFPALFALIALPVMAYAESVCLYTALKKLLPALFIYQVASAIRGHLKAFWKSIGLGPSIYYAIGLLALYSVSTLFIFWVTDFYYLPFPFTALSGMSLLMTLIRIAGLLFINTLALIVLLNKFRAIEALNQAADQIISGDPHINLRPLGGPRLEKLAVQMTHISEGLSKAIDQEVKAERLKTELITNVSHDLKTPITAISSYVDLLNQEGVNSPNAPEYLQVITRRVEKLKILTQDLFDAAKANSGNLPIELTRINLNAMVHQALGELTDALKSSSLEVHTNIPEPPIWIEADGKYLWRVLENLIGNCIKHSQPHTRVYMHLEKSNNEATLTLKNVSLAPLNIDPDQLMERFVRGDESRHTEGSGLGLAIARDLTALQKGHLDLSIDGDLFKAALTFKLSQTSST